MESRESDESVEAVPPNKVSLAIVTEQDRENARIRAAIAAEAEERYAEVLLWAMGAFGPGWLPSCRHFLVSKDDEDQARRTGEKLKAAATVYTVKDKDGSKRHFTVEDGRVVECASYQEGFGPMLLEPDPVHTIEVRGERVHPHRYSLCWAGYELYRPMSAERLAELRASRVRLKAERDEAKWREENPLLLWGLAQRDEKN